METEHEGTLVQGGPELTAGNPKADGPTVRRRLRRAELPRRHAGVRNPRARAGVHREETKPRWRRDVHVRYGQDLQDRADGTGSAARVGSTTHRRARHRNTRTSPRGPCASEPANEASGSTPTTEGVNDTKGPDQDAVRAGHEGSGSMPASPRFVGVPPHEGKPMAPEHTSGPKDIRLPRGQTGSLGAPRAERAPRASERRHDGPGVQRTRPRDDEADRRGSHEEVVSAFAEVLTATELAGNGGEEIAKRSPFRGQVVTQDVYEYARQYLRGHKRALRRL